MSLKFAANLNFLFTEVGAGLAERIRAACKAGFKAVEIAYPKDDHDSIIAAKSDTGVQIALINISVGSGDFRFGEAAIAGREEAFKKHLEETIIFAKKVNCAKIHLMSGLIQNGSFDTYLQTYKDNLKYAVQSLEREGMVGVIEPINQYAVPSYFMNSYDVAADVLREINSKHLKLMADIFHMQHICGNLTNTLKRFEELIGHIQIAQIPHRHEPNVEGELDFKYVFRLLEGLSYKDWIGCEYKPKTTTTQGLDWISEFGFQAT